MDNNIAIDEINKITDEAADFFGIKENIDHEKLFVLIRNKQIIPAVKMIAAQFGLPIEVNVRYISDSDRVFYGTSGTERFQSTQLTKTDGGDSGRGGIIAQVKIPGHLPAFGTQALVGFPIEVLVSQNCTAVPVVFAMIVSHELSHVLLHSLRHREKNNEFYTDIVAILFGFRDIYRLGRQITEVSNYGSMTSMKSSSYGYLNNGQFSFVYDKTSNILKNFKDTKSKLKHLYKCFSDNIRKYEAAIASFEYYKEYATVNPKCISDQDGKKMVEFFNIGYIDNLNEGLKKFKIKNSEVENFINSLIGGTTEKSDLIKIGATELDVDIETIKKSISQIKKDTKILKRCESIEHRIKRLFKKIIDAKGDPK